VKVIDDLCSNLIARVRQEYEFETDNIRELTGVLDQTRQRIDHSVKFARQLVQHGRPIDVVTQSPVVRASLVAAARASPVPIDAQLVVDFRAHAVDVGVVEPIFGSIEIDRVPSADAGALTARRAGSSPDDKGTTSVESDLSDTGTAVHEPVLLSSFPARTSTDSKGCKPTAVAVAPPSDEHPDGTLLIVVVDDINKKVKMFDDAGQLRLEICPEGRRRLVDPWDVAVLRPPHPSAATIHGSGMAAGASGRYVVSDRGAKDVKVFTASGEFLSSFGPHLSTPWGVCTNAARQLLVSDSGHRTVFVHDSAGILLFNVEIFKQTASGTRYHLQVICINSSLRPRRPPSLKGL